MKIGYWFLTAAVVFVIATLFYLEEAESQELLNCNGRMVWGDGTGECPRLRRRDQWRQDRYGVPREYQQRWDQSTVIVPSPVLVRSTVELTPGTIYISHKERKLYYAETSRTATVYPIAVGKEGFGWRGVEKITRVVAWPDWRPPAEMRRRKPELPAFYPGGPSNPLGAKALYLGNTLYRIHGTNDPRSIGTYASSGCIRMHNEHVLHLARKVEIGTVVVVR